MDQGLAAMGAPNGGMEQVLQEVVRLLAQGVTPEELVAQGIPVEVVKQAMQLMAAQPAPNAPSTDAGLAAMGAAPQGY